MRQLKKKFHLDRRALDWLRQGGREQDAESHEDAVLEWVLGKMSRGELTDVRGIMVDEELFAARFACVPKLCSPVAARGRYRSCCADLSVPLSPVEKNRLLRYRKRLGEYLGQVDVSYWLDEDKAAIVRPKGRCAFSEIERDGRIRCRLHAFSRTQRVEPVELLPVSCGLFPLALFGLTRGKVLVTVLQKTNHKLLGSMPPDRFPCLCDSTLPPLLESMGATLDRFFGKGFARAVRSRMHELA